MKARNPGDLAPWRLCAVRDRFKGVATTLRGMQILSACGHNMGTSGWEGKRSHEQSETSGPVVAHAEACLRRLTDRRFS
jgi:hypothetical protein